MKSLSSIFGAYANWVLAPIGLKVSRLSRGHDWGDVSRFIPFGETMAEAVRAGLQLEEYIDARQGIAGATQFTINGMKRLGVFDRPIRAIVEIGPGTGRYLAKTLHECSPERYEVYETATEWRAYLAKKFPIIVQPTDGTSLCATSSVSVDLVHAHKVFSTTNFVTAARYWCEMDRVTRPGGYIVFDVMTENCLAPATVEAWGRTGTPSRSTYPAAISSETVKRFFAAHNSTLLGSFYVPMPPGQTEVFIFKKNYYRDVEES